MRQGKVYRRCTRCGGDVNAKRRHPDRPTQHESCPGTRSTWAFVVDLALDGAPRKQVTKAGFRTKGDAQQAMAELQVDRSRGQHVESSKQTLGQYLDEWLAAVKPGYAPGAWDAMEGHVRCYLKPRLGDVRLQALTSLHVKAFLADLEANGRVRGDEKNRRPLSAKTVHNIYRTLCKALNDACDESPPRLLRNPAAKAHKMPPSPEQQTWTPEQLRAFFAYCASIDDRLLTLWRFTADSAMRRAEIAGLRWGDLDLDAARVRLATQRAKGGGTVERRVLKGKRGRSVDIDAGTVTALKAWRKRQAGEQLAWPGEWGNDEQLVFTHEDGSPLHPDSITKLFKRRVRDAGLPPLRGPHAMRHTWATLALESGIHPKVVQERLGHASIAITLDVYSHLAPGMQAEAAAKVAGIISAADADDAEDGEA